MEQLSLRWISIAKSVLNDPFAKIICPDCGIKYLNSLISPWNELESKVDVHIFCENCNARNTITKNISPVDNASDTAR